MALANWDFYKNTFLGTAIKEQDFPRLASRASEYIDRVTFGRAVEAEGDNAVAVKKAVCAVAEVLQAYDMAGGALITGIESERVGSHSVTYASGAANDALMLDVLGVSSVYLEQRGLMYRGLC